MGARHWRQRALEAEQRLADFEIAQKQHITMPVGTGPGYVGREQLPPEVFFPIYMAGKKAGREEAGDVRELDITLRGEKLTIPLGNKQALHQMLRGMDREQEKLELENAALKKMKGGVSQEQYDKVRDIAKRAESKIRPLIEQVNERDQEISRLQAKVATLQNAIMAQPKPRVRIGTDGVIRSAQNVNLPLPRNRSMEIAERRAPLVMAVADIMRQQKFDTYRSLAEKLNALGMRSQTGRAFTQQNVLYVAKQAQRVIDMEKAAA